MSQPTRDWRTEDWPRIHAFGLPAGSVRALLAIVIFGAIWAWLLLRPERDVPEYLQNLLFIIMGHYFAARKEARRGEDFGPPPLYLPTGSVRLILIGGFVVVAFVLFRQDRLWLADADGETVRHGILTLLLVAGFLLGVTVARLWALLTKNSALPRWLEDLRAFVSIAAALLLLVLVFEIIDVSNVVPVRLGGSGVNGLLAAIVGFYFGSRS